jgi:hypothetical protein
MPRPDWDITRLELSKTFYADLPTLVETLKVRHTMTHRVSGQVKVFEMNYTTPTDNDMVRQENLWIQRLELSAQVPLVPLGDIETTPQPPTPEQQKALAVANARRFADAALKSLDETKAQAEALKVALPSEAADIDKAFAPIIAAAEAQVSAAVTAIKDADALP